MLISFPRSSSDAPSRESSDNAESSISKALYPRCDLYSLPCRSCPPTMAMSGLQAVGGAQFPCGAAVELNASEPYNSFPFSRCAGFVSARAVRIPATSRLRSLDPRPVPFLRRIYTHSGDSHATSKQDLAYVCLTFVLSHVPGGQLPRRSVYLHRLLSVEPGCIRVVSMSRFRVQVFRSA